MCDLFLIVNDIDFANYADDNTPFVFGNNPIEVLKCLEDASDKLFECFSNNQMKANPDKCHLLTSSMTPTSINIKGFVINNSLCEKLLGFTIDSKLSFNAHLDKILAKARQKVHVLARIAPYMSIPKRKLIMNSFFTSQFNYCPLVWMYHSRSMNSRINRLHETCLRIICSDKSSSFEELLQKGESVTIHEKNIQKLATEMFKVFKNLLPPIVADLFEVRQNNCNLKHRSYFSIPNVKSVYHGSESLSNLGPRIWNLVPDNLKQLDDINSFKTEVKKWKPIDCPCRLCKSYIANVGFVQKF